jgi:hypothetical protein
MERDTIQQKIESFYGNMNSAFIFIGELNQTLNIDFNNIIASTNPEQKIITFVRNLINKGIITRPMKSGRSLLLSGETILEILVVKRYLNRGVSMNALVGQIAGKPKKELWDKLFVDQITDIVDITSTYSSSLIVDKDDEDELQQSDSNLFHHYKINNDLEINFREGSYPDDAIDRIVKNLKRQKRS